MNEQRLSASWRLHTASADRNSPRAAVFCDFDGTITEHDTLLSTCQRFIPDVAKRVCPAIGQGTISLRDGLEQLLGALPCRLAGDILDHVRRQAVRRGFGAFLGQLQSWNIPVVILSSSPAFCVEAFLEPWRPLIANIHALRVDLDGDYLRPHITGENDDEAVPKADIMLSYRAGMRIVIGDSISDQQMAVHADSVFARDRLLAFMRARQLPVTGYLDFYDILDALRRRSIASAAIRQ